MSTVTAAPAVPSRPKTLTTVVILLVVMALISATSTITARLAVGRNRPAGTFQNGNGGNFQNPNGGNFQGGNGTGQGGGNFQNGNGGTFQGGGTGNFAGRGGGFNAFGILRTLGLGGQFFTYFNIAIAVIGIGLLLAGAYGTWKQKRWGLNLAMIIAILFLLGALPTFFSLGGRFINWARVAESVVTAGSAVVIIALGILPSVRDSVS